MYVTALSVKASMGGGDAPTAAQLRHLEAVVASSCTVDVGVAMATRALATFQRFLGPLHASVASVSKVLGCLYANSRQESLALQHFKVAVDICEQQFGTDALVTMDVVYNVGVLFSMMGDHASAVRSFSRVERVYAAHHGLVHPLTKRVQDKLTVAQRAGMQQQYTTLFSAGLKAFTDNNYGDARVAFRGCLELMPDDPQTAYVLCACACRLGDVDAGLKWFRNAVSWGFDDVSTAQSDKDLAPLHDQPAFKELVGWMQSAPSVGRPSLSSRTRSLSADEDAGDDDVDVDDDDW